MGRYAAVALSLALLGAGTTAANAADELTCGRHADLTAALAKTYEERPSFVGLANEGHMLEVFTSAAGTWTILMTTAKGVSCLIADGESWQPAQPIKVAEPRA